jgi:hypothetical protein
VRSTVPGISRRGIHPDWMGEFSLEMMIEIGIARGQPK